MDEFKKYEVIKALVDHPNANKDRAALTLGCTKRHIYRMMAGYCKDGKAFFLMATKVANPLRLFRIKPGASWLTFTVQNTPKPTFSIIQNSWQSVKASPSPCLLSPRFWKPNISFPQRLPKPKENG